MKEEDVRPKVIFDQFLALLQKDISTYFGDDQPRKEVACVACGLFSESVFCEKDSFVYKTCDACMTIYASPRPQKSSFDRFYSDSPSTRFWASTFYRATESARREKLWKPKAQQVANIIKEKFMTTDITVIDVGGGYGVFAEEIQSLGYKAIVVEPSEALSKVCREKGLEVICQFVEDIDSASLPAVGPKCLVSFELLEHVYEPRVFLSKLYDLMKPGDLLIFTTLSGLGLDIQVLEGKSKAISPPQHLNFLNPRATEELLDNIGFQGVSVSTPGKLDVDILMNNASDVPAGFWANFLNYAEESQRDDLQAFCAKSGFSSHMMVVASR